MSKTFHRVIEDAEENMIDQEERRLRLILYELVKRALHEPLLPVSTLISQTVKELEEAGLI